MNGITLTLSPDSIPVSGLPIGGLQRGAIHPNAAGMAFARDEAAADLPKKIDWDQSLLAALVEARRAPRVAGALLLAVLGVLFAVHTRRVLTHLDRVRPVGGGDAAPAFRVPLLEGGTFALEPGDVIFAGTPEGVGAVSRGQTMVGTIEGVGEIRLTVV